MESFEKVKKEEKIEDNYKIVRFDLIPFIFTEKYEYVNDLIQDSEISDYSFLNVINIDIITKIQFKHIEDRIKNRLSKVLHVEKENIKLILNKRDEVRFIFNCWIKIYRKSIDVLINKKSQVNKYAKEKFYNQYMKYYYKTEYKGTEHDSYFYYIAEYLYSYLAYIYGDLCVYDNLYISDISENFTKKGTNPTIYDQNIIPFKEIRTETKDITNVTIMKMGFVFSDMYEPKKNILFI